MLRSHQIEPANRLLEILRAGGNAVDLSDTGTGKCLGKGTSVLMFDGSIRAVETVAAGEELMGDDGTSRRVLQTSRGSGPLFKITPKGNGLPWICNGDHILVLNSTSLGLPYRTWAGGEIKEISVNRYLTLPKHERVSRWKLFYSAGWEGRESSLAVDPYIYGLWLGDGAIFHGGLTTADAPIKRAWNDYFLRKGFRMREDRQSGNAATTYVPACNPATKAGKTNKQMRPNFWRRFSTLSCNQKSKFIYPEYLSGSRAQRLALLAGLLDSDGHLCNGLNTFEITQKSEKLSEQISFLARSLGFKVSVKQNFKTCQTGNGGWYFRIFISGDTASIPTILTRKKATPRSLFKRHNVFGFSVASAGEGEYFGFVIDGNRRFLLGDFTVTHNTYVACAVASSINLPLTVAVIPKIAHTAWQAAAKHFDFRLPTIGYEALRTGRSPFGRWEHQPPVPFKADEFFLCESCQCKVDFEDYRPCHCHPNGTHCIKTKKHPWKYGNFIWAPEVKFLVADEVHRCSGLDSLNSDLLIAAKRQGIRILGLSATAACTPLQMRALGYALDLHGLNQNLAVRPKPEELIVEPLFSPRPHLPTFYQWAGRYDCRPDPVYRGLKWFASAERQKTIMADLHSKIIPERGVRVRTADIPGFPERLITAELYDLEKDYEIRKLYIEMENALETLKKRAAEDSDSEHPLTAQLRARQRIELIKVPIFVELAEDELAKGNSVAIFVNFRATIDELSKRLHAFNPGIVDGSAEGVRGRDTAIAAFQRNDNRVILLNSAAGGVAIGLQDLDGEHPRAALVSPSFSAVQMLQIFGRLPRDGGKSLSRYRIILAANTVETRIQKAFQAKQSCIEALNDSDMNPLTTAEL